MRQGRTVAMLPAVLVFAVMAATGVPEEIENLEIRNARMPATGLLTGGQLSQDQMVALKELGYKTFINLRLATEEGTGWEEEYAGEIGVVYVRIPVQGAAGMNQDNMESLAETLESAEGSTVVYCASGNRVGGLLAMKAHFIDDMSAEDSLEFGLEAGLTRLEPQVRKLLGLEN